MEQLLFNTLAILIVATAILIAVRRIVVSFFKKKEPTCDSGCDGCAAKCEIKHLGNLKKTTH